MSLEVHSHPSSLRDLAMYSVTRTPTPNMEDRIVLPSLVNGMDLSRPPSTSSQTSTFHRPSPRPNLQLPTFRQVSAMAAAAAAAASASEPHYAPITARTPPPIMYQGTPAATVGPGGQIPVCGNCGTNFTPLWRRDEQGTVLCNACGLFLKLHGKPRPISLKTDVIKSRNRVKPQQQPRKRNLATSNDNSLPESTDPNHSHASGSRCSSASPGGEVQANSNTATATTSILPPLTTTNHHHHSSQHSETAALAAEAARRVSAARNPNNNKRSASPLTQPSHTFKHPAKRKHPAPDSDSRSSLSRVHRIDSHHSSSNPATIMTGATSTHPASNHHHHHNHSAVGSPARSSNIAPQAIFDSVTLEQPSPGYVSPRMANNPFRPVSPSAISAPSRYPPGTANGPKSLQTRVSELEVINSLFKGSLREMENRLAEAKRAEEESTLEKHSLLSEIHDLKRKVASLEAENAHLRRVSPSPSKRIRLSDVVEDDNDILSLTPELHNV